MLSSGAALSSTSAKVATNGESFYLGMDKDHLAGLVYIAPSEDLMTVHDMVELTGDATALGIVRMTLDNMVSSDAAPLTAQLADSILYPSQAPREVYRRKSRLLFALMATEKATDIEAPYRDSLTHAKEEIGREIAAMQNLVLLKAPANEVEAR